MLTLTGLCWTAVTGSGAGAGADIGPLSVVSPAPVPVSAAGGAAEGCGGAGGSAGGDAGGAEAASGAALGGFSAVASLVCGARRRRERIRARPGGRRLRRRLHHRSRSGGSRRVHRLLRLGRCGRHRHGRDRGERGVDHGLWLDDRFAADVGSRERRPEAGGHEGDSRCHENPRRRHPTVRPTHSLSQSPSTANSMHRIESATHFRDISLRAIS